MASTNLKLACLDCNISYSVKLSSDCEKPADYCPLCGGQNLGGYDDIVSEDPTDLDGEGW